MRDRYYYELEDGPKYRGLYGIYDRNLGAISGMIAIVIELSDAQLICTALNKHASDA